MFYSCCQSAGNGNVRLLRCIPLQRNLYQNFFFLYMIYSWEWTKQSDEENLPSGSFMCVWKSFGLIRSQTCYSWAPAPVSDTHRSAPLPSDMGHQSVAPVLPRTFTAKYAQTPQWRDVVAQLLIMDRRANTRCCGTIMAAVSTCLTWIETKWHTLKTNSLILP